MMSRAIFALLAAVCLRASTASAYEGQQHVGLQGASILEDGELNAHLSAFYTYDVSDSWRLTGSVAQTTGSFSRQGARVGVGYVIDVLRYVPWISADGGVDLWRDGSLRPIGGGAVGLDVQWSREWSTGALYRMEWMLGPSGGNPNTNAQFGLRAMYTWGK